MGKSKKSKYVGSCGIYVFFHDGTFGLLDISMQMQTSERRSWEIQRSKVAATESFGKLQITKML